MNEPTKYLALLRGVNVGGRSKLKMADLRVVLASAGFDNPVTYIQSGNVVFSSGVRDTVELSVHLRAAIDKQFGLDVDVVVFSSADWLSIINDAPEWWGSDPSRKHNLLILPSPDDEAETMAAIGRLNPDVEAAQAGKGVVYQSMSLKLTGKTLVGKLTSRPISRRTTIRNFRTATKLLDLLG